MAALRDQVVLITGCSSGIGRALAREFAAAGHRVVATARRPEAIAGLEGKRIAAMALDVTDPASIARCTQAAFDRFERIDVLVNNAGWGLMGPIAELDLEGLRQQFETNVVGPVAMVQALVHEMARRRHGRVINIGSVSGVTTTPYSGAYCASKAALHAINEAMRVELAPFGIDVVLVQPGAIASSFGKSASKNLERYREENSLYHRVHRFIEGRAELSQKSPTDPADFAREMVRRTMAGNPPAMVRIGKGSHLLPALGKLPAAVLDRILTRRFGLDALADYATSALYKEEK